VKFVPSVASAAVESEVFVTMIALSFLSRWSATMRAAPIIPSELARDQSVEVATRLLGPESLMVWAPSPASLMCQTPT